MILNVTKLIKSISISVVFLSLPFCSIGANSWYGDIKIITAGSGHDSFNLNKLTAMKNAIHIAHNTFFSPSASFNIPIWNIPDGIIKSFDVIYQGKVGSDFEEQIVIGISIVSLDSLASHLAQVGLISEIQGGNLAIKVKNQVLIENIETSILVESIGQIHNGLQQSFDYQIQNGDPISTNSNGTTWRIPIRVDVKCNYFMDSIANLLINTISSITMSNEEILKFQSQNRPTYPIYLSYKGKKHEFRLRKESSYKILNSLNTHWEYYARNFVVFSGIDASKGAGNATLKKLQESNSSSIFFKLPSSGETICSFTWQEDRTIAEIEKMTSYSVKSLGRTTRFRDGGFEVTFQNEQGSYQNIIISIFDLERATWEVAVKSCEDFHINSYSDWFLPSKDQLVSIGKILPEGYGDIKGSYWSGSYYPGNEGKRPIYVIIGSDIDWTSGKSIETRKVRPIRFVR